MLLSVWANANTDVFISSNKESTVSRTALNMMWCK